VIFYSYVSLPEGIIKIWVSSRVSSRII
jgi:hypothetical protein